jgi:uncharacterized membrane protein YgaE (UPF0421/DUF939 family)
MGLKSTWRENERVRRAAMGAVAGAIAGITAASLQGSLFERYGVALVIGLIVFVALKLLVD